MVAVVVAVMAAAVEAACNNNNNNVTLLTRDTAAAAAGVDGDDGGEKQRQTREGEALKHQCKEFLPRRRWLGHAVSLGSQPGPRTAGRKAAAFVGGNSGPKDSWELSEGQQQKWEFEGEGAVHGDRRHDGGELTPLEPSSAGPPPCEAAPIASGPQKGV